MYRFIKHCMIGLGALGLLWTQAPGQDYQDTFKKPETALEFWAAMRYEIAVGSYQLAAANLKGFLDKKPTDKELIQIEEKEGLPAFLQLLTIPETRKDAGPLVERMGQVLERHLTSAERIKKFIANLQATPEERSFAINELQRARAFAIPYLIEAMRENPDPALHSSILGAIYHLKKNAVPALRAALDVSDNVLLAEIIDALYRRNDKEAVPYLWYLSAAAKYPESIHRKAKQALAALLGVEADKLPSAKVALTDEANRYYKHEVRFSDPQKEVVWQLQPDGRQWVMPPPVLTASQAEEYYGLRFARQALDLDPAYEPAQIVLLSLALEKAFERAGIDQPLERGSPQITDLLRSVNPGLVTAVLERALRDHRLPVILGAVRALADLTETRSAQPKGTQPAALVQALNYPDRRVQVAAADALLRLPTPPPPFVRGRIVEVLRRTLAGDPQPRALVGDSNVQRGNELGRAVKQAGFDAAVVSNGRDVLHRLQEASDVDILLLDQGIIDPGLQYLIAQLRSDADNSAIPIIITVSPEGDGTVTSTRARALSALTSSYRNVWLMPGTLDVNKLKTTLNERIAQAMEKPLSDAERKGNMAVSMYWLRRMATGEQPGYELRPAEGVILRTLRSKELSPMAVNATGALPGRDAQRALAAVLLDAGQPPELRAAAAFELTRHIQHFGKLLVPDQIKAIETLFATSTDPKLRTNVAMVIGSMRPGAAETANRLQRYAPPPPAAAAPPANEEKGQEKQEKQEK